MKSIIKKAVHRIQMLVGRAIIEAVADSDEIQLVKMSGLDGEVTDGIERIQNYGFSSNVPAGGEAVVLYVQGNREDGIVVAADHGGFRIKDLKSGETVMYSQHGQTLKHDENGDTVFNGGSNNAVQHQALRVQLEKLQDDFNAHTHAYNPGPGAAIATPTPIPQNTSNFDAPKIDEIKVP